MSFHTYGTHKSVNFKIFASGETSVRGGRRVWDRRGDGARRR